MSETREAILTAAQDIYLREGLAGLSMRKVARIAGISATAIYRHFESKEAMLFGLVVDGSHMFLRYLSLGLTGKSAVERLALSGEGYLRFAIEQPSYYRIMFMAPKEHLGLAKLNEKASKEFAPTFVFLVDRVRECMAAGALADGDPDAVSAIIWAHCHGLCSLKLSDHFGLMSEAQFAALYQRGIAALLQGLA